MSQENVERVERLYEQLNRGEIDAGLAVLAPDVQWWTRRDNPDTALVQRLRDGQVIEFREFHEKGEALETVGLED